MFEPEEEKGELITQGRLQIDISEW